MEGGVTNMVFQEFISTVAKRMEERYKEMGQDYSVTIKNRERVNRENSSSIVVKSQDSYNNQVL